MLRSKTKEPHHHIYKYSIGFLVWRCIQDYISNTSDLYTQFTSYRIETIEERSRVKSQRAYNIPETRRWLQQQRDFIDCTLQEIIEV